MHLQVVGNLAYIAGDDLKIVDVSNPEQPKLLSVYEARSSDVQIVGRLAYLTERDSSTEWHGNVQVVDLGILSRPRPQATYRLPTNMDEIVVVGDVVYVETEGLRIFRIHPDRLLSSIFLPRIGK